MPPPWDPAGHRDGFDLVATELPWRTIGGVAYDADGVRITHFPAVHDRQGSISYKLEWNGLSMVFSGDTRPTQYIIDQATAGVDVFIHEMVVPPRGVGAQEHRPQAGRRRAGTRRSRRPR